jgi:hypothetical protein
VRRSTHDRWQRQGLRATAAVACAPTEKDYHTWGTAWHACYSSAGWVCSAFSVNGAQCGAGQIRCEAQLCVYVGGEGLHCSAVSSFWCLCPCRAFTHAATAARCVACMKTAQREGKAQPHRGCYKVNCKAARRACVPLLPHHQQRGLPAQCVKATDELTRLRSAGAYRWGRLWGQRALAGAGPCTGGCNKGCGPAALKPIWNGMVSKLTYRPQSSPPTSGTRAAEPLARMNRPSNRRSKRGWACPLTGGWPGAVCRGAGAMHMRTIICDSKTDEAATRP